MNAYKCDICGDFFIQRRVTKLPNGQGLDFHIIEAVENLRRCDVCPDCSKRIEDMLKELSNKWGDEKK